MTTPPAPRGIVLLGAVFVGCFALGTLDPDAWWGTHFLAFAPPAARYSLFALAFVLVLVPWSDVLRLPGLPRMSIGRAAIVAGGMAALFWALPIHVDFYGDAPDFRDAFEAGNAKTDPLALLLSLDLLHSKTGERTVLNAVRLIAGEGGDYLSVFRALGAVCGGLFTYLWLRFVDAVVSERRLALALALAGLTAPFLQMFFGHVEVYGPSIVVVAAFLMTAHRALESTRGHWTWVLLPLWLLALKLHASALLLLPALFVCVLRRFRPEWINWRAASVGLLLPMFALGAVVYFAVLGDHADPRTMDEFTPVIERLFLPFLPPQPPLDRYTLLGAQHLFDYVNLLFTWSAPAIFALAALAIFARGSANWASPSAIVSGVTLALYAALFFMVNPLLGMEMDWDLLSLPAPALLVFTAVVASRVQWPQLAGPALALCLLSPAAFYVNHDRTALSERLISLGKSAFGGYWIRSAGTLDFGIGLTDDPKARYREMLTELEPLAHRGGDREYAHLWWRLGKLERAGGSSPADLEVAFGHHLEAFEWAPDYGPNLIGLVDASFRLGQFDEALRFASRLVEIGHPSLERALRIAIHCAIEAGNGEAARRHSESYLRRRSDAPVIRAVHRGLVNGEHPFALRRFFGGRD